MAVSVARARELIMSLAGATAAPHGDREAFRAGGNIFASLRQDGILSVKLNLEEQELRCVAAPDKFKPVEGGWGKMGFTSINLSVAEELDIKSALLAAWAGSQKQVAANKKKKPKL